MSRLVHSCLDLKFWEHVVPEVEAVRPARCVGCGVASRCPGQALTVVGHGVRERQLRGPREPGAKPEELTIGQRRFRCRKCGAVMVVAPAQVLRYRLFSSVAIASSLVLYGVEFFAAARVRQLISPWRVVGATAARSWKTLGRWIAAIQSHTLLPITRPLPHKPKAAASAAALLLAALAPPSFRVYSLAHQAAAGALHALMGITPWSGSFAEPTTAGEFSGSS